MHRGAASMADEGGVALARLVQHRGAPEGAVREVEEEGVRRGARAAAAAAAPGVGGAGSSLGLGGVRHGGPGPGRSLGAGPNLGLKGGHGGLGARWERDGAAEVDVG